MSGHGFHVHGPHDHAVEHAAHGGDSFSNNIAVMTAILATVGALFGYLGGATQNDAALFKNNAAIDKTEAANAWNYYQAKSNKQNLAEMAMTLPGVDPAKYKAEVARYEGEKEDIKKKAEKFEASSAEWNHKSDARDAPAPPVGAGHHRRADRHFAGGDHPADAQALADDRRLRRWPRSAWRWACSPGCTSTRSAPCSAAPPPPPTDP